MTEPINVLISLYKGYGLGDAVQMSAVLRHVARYRPHWRVDYQAEEGRHCVGRGIVAQTFAYDTPYPHARYDTEVQIVLHDTFANWHDRPNTRVSSCLHDRFGLGWDPTFGRYQVHISPEAALLAAALVSPGESAKWGKYGNRRGGDGCKVNGRAVAIHYRGDSSPTRKDLTHEQAARICKTVELLGYTPLLLDWRNTSPLPDDDHIRTTGLTPMSKVWGADAEMNCAVISQCAAFIGIDSGPSKCASATDTPALVVWTGHHPAPFHDPAPNTTHLVPRGYHGLEPVCDDEGVVAWFERHYDVRTYRRDPVGEVAVWLKEVLR